MMKNAKAILAVSILALALVVGGLAASEQKRGRLILATTTSTYDSGLLDAIVPKFEEKYHVSVDILSLGTGQALKTAESGDADVVLVHDRAAEEAFVKGGHGMHRVGVMYNDFILVGPKSDPAGIAALNNATEAFVRIAKAGATFISRGDDSATHKREKSLWAKAGIQPSGSWYLEAGQGMGNVLRMANEKGGYTLSDRGTWLFLSGQLNLKILVQGDLTLLNPYGAILVSLEKHPSVNYRMAVAFVKFLTSNEGQRLIGGFKRDGEALFIPIARNFNWANMLGFPKQEEAVAWYEAQSV